MFVQGAWRISIHAPVKGATRCVLGVGGILLDFNPRSREGSDHRTSMFQPTTRYFNPRSREGSDSFFSVFELDIPNFNPRSREGSDINIRYGIRHFIHFNPRSREGSDGWTGFILVTR